MQGQREQVSWGLESTASTGYDGSGFLLHIACLQEPAGGYMFLGGAGAPVTGVRYAMVQA